MVTERAKPSRRRAAQATPGDGASPGHVPHKNVAAKAADPKPDSLEHFAPHVMTRVINGMNASLLRRLRLLHMSVPHYRVLQILSAYDGSTLSEIAQLCVVKQSTLSRVVDQMEERKFVQRRIDPKDSRFVQVFLTELGRRLFEQAWGQALSVANSCMRSLNDAEKAMLLHILHKIDATTNSPIAD
jgi:DNA-binding MarR family transcriptional regulator